MRFTESSILFVVLKNQAKDRINVLQKLLRMQDVHIQLMTMHALCPVLTGDCEDHLIYLRHTQFVRSMYKLFAAEERASRAINKRGTKWELEM